jgi:hypothetical protein
VKLSTKLTAPQAKVEEITKEQLGSMVSDVFGEVPATFNSCWDESMPPNRSAMDPPRLIKFFYLTVKPKGCFHPSIYKPNIIQTIPTIVSLPTIETTQIEPKRINPVIVSKFKRGKLLGKGGQGTVHLGTYDGEVKNKNQLSPALLAPPTVKWPLHLPWFHPVPLF